MFQPDQDGIYATVSASPMRRLFACGVLFLLGGLVIYIALLPPFKVVLTPLLLALGIGTLVIGDKLRRATLLSVYLTADDVRSSDGEVLATLAEIEAVNRGAFAFKPSHGFTLILKSSGPRSWAPGMWWRLGRRLGVGGVTASGQTKFMAEQIALRISTT
ncbi:hypothetical protein [Yoonia sp. 208BN28-4]|uniref:hypothetical protein n=1 Tax=Yoonia sp. 208BN28-4 TaxID=3126505 RepID=UPI0030A0594B